MPVLLRFALLIGIGLLIYYFVSVRKRRLDSEGSGEVRIMPYCPKCESNRHVIPNTGNNPSYPRDKVSWFCEGCQEGF